MKKMNKGSRLAVAGALLILAVAAGVALSALGPGRSTSYTGSAGNPSQSQNARNAAIIAAPVGERPMAGKLAFADADGKPYHLEDFRGRVILLNLWATWCPPCVAEMPDLDTLQSTLGGEDFQVVAVSLDRGGAPVAAGWLDRAGLTALDVYVANPGDHPGAALPTSILIDAQGRVAWKGTGARHWMAPQAVETVRAVINEAKSGI